MQRMRNRKPVRRGGRPADVDEGILMRTAGVRARSRLLLKQVEAEIEAIEALLDSAARWQERR